MEGRNNRILEIDSLAIYFGGLKAIDGVSLYIEKNDFLGLIGPNGAGKSTLFNAITGNIVPTMGTIAFNNTVINKKRPDQICHLGISRTFQNIRLFPKMTAIENVSIGMNSIPKYSLLQAAIRSGKVEQINRETIDQAYYYLDLLGIAGYKDNLAGSLPYGLQRRLEIARAIATRCCWPPESWPGRCKIRWARPTCSSACAARARRRERGTPRYRSGSSTFSSALRLGIR